MRTHASAIGAANISDLTSHAYVQKAAKRVNMNCFGKMSANAYVFLRKDSFTNHNTGNFLRHSINITANQRLFPTFQGNQNTIIGGAIQTSLSPILFEGGGVCTQATCCELYSFF